MWEIQNNALTPIGQLILHGGSVLTKKDIVLSLFIILSLNSLQDINIAQAIVALGVFGVFCYTKYMESQEKPDIAGDLKKDMDSLKNLVSGMAIKQSAKPSQMSQEIKRLF